jgi:hypothetical protein
MLWMIGEALKAAVGGASEKVEVDIVGRPGTVDCVVANVRSEFVFARGVGECSGQENRIR